MLTGLTSTDRHDLTYALTVHKSQGSEYPVVIVQVLLQHSIMLRRNMLYTAITRARKMVGAGRSARGGTRCAFWRFASRGVSRMVFKDAGQSPNAPNL